MNYPSAQDAISELRTRYPELRFNVSLTIWRPGYAGLQHVTKRSDLDQACQNVMQSKPLPPLQEREKVSLTKLLQVIHRKKE